MKYTRTKDGIYKTVTDMWGHKQLLDKNGNVLRFAIDKQKQANTIKELCDTTVKIFDDGFTIVGDDLSTKEGHFVLYGAIWTDKGLIYVAKMNEKGELELL